MSGLIYFLRTSCSLHSHGPIIIELIVDVVVATVVVVGSMNYLHLLLVATL